MYREISGLCLMRSSLNSISLHGRTRWLEEISGWANVQMCRPVYIQPMCIYCPQPGHSSDIRLIGASDGLINCNINLS